MFIEFQFYNKNASLISSNIGYLVSKYILYYLLGDLFENYCRSDDLVTFGRFCYGITVILTYPIECFVTREVSTVPLQYFVQESSLLHLIWVDLSISLFNEFPATGQVVVFIKSFSVLNC
jgi:hypothetical protein